MWDQLTTFWSLDRAEKHYSLKEQPLNMPLGSQNPYAKRAYSILDLLDLVIQQGTLILIGLHLHNYTLPSGTVLYPSSGHIPEGNLTETVLCPAPALALLHVPDANLAETVTVPHGPALALAHAANFLCLAVEKEPLKHWGGQGSLPPQRHIPIKKFLLWSLWPPCPHALWVPVATLGSCIVVGYNQIADTVQHFVPPV